MMLNLSISDQVLPPVAGLRLRSVIRVSPMLALPALSTSVAAAESGNGAASTLVPVLLGALVVAALIIFGLTNWSRKQDSIGNMMLFCMKYLVNSADETQRRKSARALGRVDDPGALLVLVSVIWDEEEPETVRRVAGESLHEMGSRFPKYKKLISDFEAAVEQRNIPDIIGILTAHFEQGGTEYVQSAYTIGRHYMRLGLYVDAREWLRKARVRNRKFNLYGSRIRYWIRQCNSFLLEEANDSFDMGDYLQAKEHYAALGQGLSGASKRLFAIYLRSACVYCKLKDYCNADEALLQALDHNHEADLALLLAPLLREMRSLEEARSTRTDKRGELGNTIDEYAGRIMAKLLSQDMQNREERDDRTKLEKFVFRDGESGAAPSATEG